MTRIEKNMSRTIIETMIHHRHVDNEFNKRIACKWTDERGKRCPKELLLSSFPRHVADKHLRIYGSRCKFCNREQSRANGMTRHYQSCKVFQQLDCETQEKEWNEATRRRSFSVYEEVLVNKAARGKYA